MIRKICYMTLLVSMAQMHGASNVSDSAITFELNKGRFGDNVFSCSQAFWMHYHYGMPFLFKIFNYSSGLKIHYAYPHYTKEMARNYARKVSLRRGMQIESGDHPILYVTHYTEHLDVDWSDCGFVEAFRAMMAPADFQAPHNDTLQPSHAIALHVRRGGTHRWDKKYFPTRPLQFPSLHYYVEALQILLCHLKGSCIVHIFTDDLQPENIAHEIRKQLSQKDQARVQITYRTEGNRDDRNVLTDFFDMMHFKYLIRTVSRYSTFVEQLGTCSISICPATAIHKKKDWGTITEANVTIFVEGESRTEKIVLSDHIPVAGKKTKKRGEAHHVQLLQIPELDKILLDPQQKVVNRVLQPVLPWCY